MTELNTTTQMPTNNTEHPQAPTITFDDFCDEQNPNGAWQARTSLDYSCDSYFGNTPDEAYKAWRVATGTVVVPRPKAAAPITTELITPAQALNVPAARAYEKTLRHIAGLCGEDQNTAVHAAREVLDAHKATIALQSAELIGTSLDLAVAVAWNVELDKQGMPIWFDVDGSYSTQASFEPSTNHGQRDPILVDYRIKVRSVASSGHTHYEATIGTDTTAIGPTEGVAAMRAFVIHKLGSTFIVPVCAQKRLTQLQLVWRSTEKHWLDLADEGWVAFEGARLIRLDRAGRPQLILLEDMTEQEIELRVPENMGNLRYTATKRASCIQIGDLIDTGGEDFVAVQYIHEDEDNPRHLTFGIEGRPSILAHASEPIDVLIEASPAE